MKVTLTKEKLKQIIKEEWDRSNLEEMHQCATHDYDHSADTQDQELDYEGNMTKGQLFTIGDAALKLHDMIKDEDNLPEWMQSKIAQAQEMIQSTYNAYRYDKKRGTL